MTKELKSKKADPASAPESSSVPEVEPIPGTMQMLSDAIRRNYEGHK